MQQHVKMRKDYVKLVQQGKRKDAQKLLRKIWKRDIVSEDDSKITSTPKKLTEKKPNYSTLNSLSKIDGIGNKTLKDIKIMFKDIGELKMALTTGSVGLRDDIVSKLKTEIL